MLDKPAWRRELLRRRGLVAPAQRRSAARAIARAVMSLPETGAARIVGLYADFRGEVPTARLGLMLALAGKIVALPAVEESGKTLVFRRIGHRRQLARGAYGIREPGRDCPAVTAGDLDLICVPGVGFDRGGYRLGYGGGYYDRFLPLLDPACLKVGLAFACQVVPLLPRGPLDQAMHVVVTEEGTWRAPSRVYHRKT
ncbi:MAG: 5-formyltetrahydrofolate cyclo-ligase [Patescibacteria group bacterium]